MKASLLLASVLYRQVDTPSAPPRCRTGVTTFVTGPKTPELLKHVEPVVGKENTTIITGSAKEAQQVEAHIGNPIAGNIVVSPWQSVVSPQSEAQKKFVEYLELFQEFIDNESENTVLNEYELSLFRANFKDLVSFFVINQWGEPLLI